MTLYDGQGKKVTLGESVGRGGEATVYRILDQPGRLAKIYEPAPRPNYASKLAWMAGHPPANPTRDMEHPSLAWPDGLIFDSRKQLKGYGMPHIRQAVALLEVFNPRRRTLVLPSFDRRYLHRTARNLAAAMSALHRSGYVAGDINESNVLVTPAALVTLIDTDSFQVREERSGKPVFHRCPVGKPEYTPPELQGKALGQMDRSPDHDAFGLAVLIFQLLMEGSHPFRAQWLAAGDPPPLEERIARGMFPYVANPAFPIAPPRRALSLDTLHPWLAELFRRCFVDGHRDPRYRPGPDLWMKALTRAEEALVCCAQGHFYAGHLDRCPYCTMASRPQPRPPEKHRTEHQRAGGRPQPAQRPAPAPRRAPQRTPPPRRSGGWNPASPGRPAQTGSGTAAAARPGVSPFGGWFSRPPAARPNRPVTQSIPNWGSFPNPVTLPGVGLRRRVGINSQVVRQWISERAHKSMTVGGGVGALAGALPGATIALMNWSAAEPLAWPILFAVGGAAGGMLRGWKPGYKLGSLIAQFVGWQNFWQGVGMVIGGTVGLLVGLMFAWLIIPIFLGIALGAQAGKYLGSKVYLVGNLVGWERVWGGLSAVLAAVSGWGISRGFAALGAGALGTRVIEILLPFSGNGEVQYALLWALVGALGGALSGMLSGLLSDLVGRLTGLVN